MEQEKLVLIKGPTTFKLIIPEEVERKIRHLCQRIHDVEWSGTLFYTYEGSIEDNNLIITCQDIFVMDIGSQTYTEFDMSPDVISYMCDKPELLDMQMGLIHSHNNMSTFFSGTDTATLKEEGRDRNHFVSLIVNNEGTYTAAITRKLKINKVVQERYSYNTFNDYAASGTREYNEEDELIEYFMLDITKEGRPFSFEEIDSRLDEIKKKKEAAKAPKGLIFPSPEPRLFNSTYQPEFVHNGDLKSKPLVETESAEYTISEIDVQNTLIQIITGSIIIKDPSKIDTERWASSMFGVFNNRFGAGAEGLKKFESWADAYCEFLIFDKLPSNLDAKSESDWVSDFSSKLYTALEKLPSNVYIEIFKSTIEQWMIQ